VKSRRSSSGADAALLEARVMLATIVVIVLVIAAVVTAIEIVCLALALYELLNGEVRSSRLDAMTVLPALVNVAVESIALTTCVLLLPFGWLPPRAAARSTARAPGSAPDVPAAGARPVLVLVATWPFNRGSFTRLRRRLRRDGWTDTVGVNLPVIGTDLEGSARALQRGLDAVAAVEPARPIVLVGHGTGGVVCRAYLRAGAGRTRVTKLMTLASPHGGSKLYVLATGRLLGDLRPEAAALRELGDGDATPSIVDCTAIYSSFDLQILPSRLAYYPGAGNIEVEGVGHFAMLWSRRIYELVRENLEYVAPPLAPPAEKPHTQPAA